MRMTGGFLLRKRIEEEKVVPWTINLIDIHLQYWPHDNLITDGNGDVVYDIFSIITPSDLAMFKDNPYWDMYFLHVSQSDILVGISYQDPRYFEKGDYERYPSIRSQATLRSFEVDRFNNMGESELSNFEFRRKMYPELYDS